MRLVALVLLLCAGLGLSPVAFGEIEKLATYGENGISFHWWPKLAPLAGWHHDRESSLRIAANVLVPDGSTFGGAQTVIYAKALYKPRDPEMKSLGMVIERDKRGFAENAPGTSIEEALPLATADGKRLRSFTFFPKSNGNWERVSYGEEGDFYLLFVISSRSLAGYHGDMAAYEQLVGRYRENP